MAPPKVSQNEKKVLVSGKNPGAWRIFFTGLMKTQLGERLLLEQNRRVLRIRKQQWKSRKTEG